MGKITQVGVLIRTIVNIENNFWYAKNVISLYQKIYMIQVIVSKSKDFK